MRWLWNKILKPVLKGSLTLLWHTFKWAFQHPTVGISVGLVALIGSIFIDDDATQVVVAAWGIGLVISGVLGWAMTGVDKYMKVYGQTVRYHHGGM